MNLSSIKKNFIYNVIYQVLLILLPFISVPYISRVMGVEGMGEYSYTYSIVNYFMLLAMLGISNYGNKSISYFREKSEEIERQFWSIYSIQFFMSLIMIISYLIYLIIFCEKYLFISIVQIPFLLSCLFDINWFFFGLENFKLTVTRNIIIKLISISCILIFVKSPNDVWKYTFIMSFSTLISQIILWKKLFKIVNFYLPKYREIKIHIKNSLILFIPVISYSIYKIMDKTMLGSIKNTIDLGYFEYAEKIYNMPLGIITALGTIMLPRISNMLYKNQEKEILKLTYKSFEFVYFIAFPIIFGLIGVGKNFCILFLGKEYQKCGDLLMILSICIIFISIANVIRTQILIPRGKNKEYIIATCIGAIINLIINLITIPRVGALGACFGTVVAEFSVMMYQVTYIKDIFFKKNNIIKLFKYLFFSIIMFLPVYFMNYLGINLLLKVILQVIVGILVYSILNYKYIINLLCIGG